MHRPSFWKKRNRAEVMGACPTPHKRAYGTRAAAKKARNDTHAGKPLGIYRCECGLYHLGFAPESRERAREVARDKLDRQQA